MAGFYEIIRPKKSVAFVAEEFAYAKLETQQNMSDTLICKKPQSWIAKIAMEIAITDWSSLAARMNIEPSKISMQLPTGSTPLDHSRKLMEHLSNTCVTVNQLCAGLRRCGNERAAYMIENEEKPTDTVQQQHESIGQFKVRNYNQLTPQDKMAVLMSAGVANGTASRIAASGGCADFFSQLELNNSFSEASLDISIWSTVPRIRDEMLAFARKYNLAVRGAPPTPETRVYDLKTERFVPATLTLNNEMATDDSLSPLEAALAAQSQKTKPLTVEEFVNSPALAHFRAKLCLATDEQCNFVRLLTELGLISQPGMSKFVGDLKARWLADRTGEPTLTILKTLARNPEKGGKPVDDLFKVFERLKVREISAAINEYRRHRDGKAKSSADRNQASFEAEDDMRQFLLSTNFSTDATIDDDMEAMRATGADTVQDLYELELADFKEAFGAKFKVARVRKLINLLKQAAANSSDGATAGGATGESTTATTAMEKDDALF